MTEVYVIRNQNGHYWGKGKEWVSGSEPKTVFRVKHEDEAVNTLFELSTRDVELRGEVVAAELSERGDPVVEPSQVPLPSVEGEGNPEPGLSAAVEPTDSTVEEVR